MRVLFNIGHPAHVHLFKNLIWNLEKRGHECKITAIDKEVSLHLLNAYGFSYVTVGSARPSLFSKAKEMTKIERQLYNIAKLFKPDILVGGVGNIYIAHIGKLMKIPSVIFDDTEHAKFEHFLMDKFADVICTPSCYKKELGKRQIRYNGYHELAYLHPKYFTPNPAVLDEIGLSKDDTFIILRFVSWAASHDVGQHGIKGKVKLVRELERYGWVLITSEGRLPKELERYRIKVSPEKLHDLLYYASLYVGEGGTTASEAAVLGTPAVFVSTIVPGYLYDEEEYGLVHVFSDPKTGEEEGMKRALELLKNDNLKNDTQERRIRLLKDKIDVTAFMVWFVENYPESFKMMKENPDIQHKFR